MTTGYAVTDKRAFVPWVQTQYWVRGGVNGNWYEYTYFGRSASTENQYFNTASNNGGTKPSGAGAYIAVGDDCYPYGTTPRQGPYKLVNAKEITITATASGGAVKQKIGSTYYDLPRTYVMFDDGQPLTVVLKAFPDASHVWNKWSDNDTTQERTFTVSADWAGVADFSCEAQFTQAYRLTTGSNNTSAGKGYIGSSGTLQDAYYVSSESVLIRADVIDAENYKFSRWTLNGYEFFGNSVNEQTFQMGSADRAYTAIFIPKKYTLNTQSNNDGYGTRTVYVNGNLSQNNTGITAVGQSDLIKVVATPSWGYAFSGWYVNGQMVSSSATYEFTMPDANVTYQATFVALQVAVATVSKYTTLQSPNASLMGSLKMYNRGTTLDKESPVGTGSDYEGFTGSLYVGQTYKIVAEQTGIYGFVKWVDGSNNEITTGGIYTVDGLTIYVTPVSTTAITIKAEFTERNNCDILGEASPSSDYVASNDAEDGGCSVAITTPDVQGVWLSGQNITAVATQGFGWDLRIWIARDSNGNTIDSISKGNVGFGQEFTFFLPADVSGDVEVIAISAYVLPPDKMEIKAVYKSGSTNEMGSLEIKPCGNDYVESVNGVSSFVDDGDECELTAIPLNGYRFVKWYRLDNQSLTQVSTVPTYVFTVSANAQYEAEFEQADAEHLVLFEGGEAKRNATWRGRTNIAKMPVNFSSARVYADGYPVSLDVGSAESPANPHLSAYIRRSFCTSQNPIRLPLRRPEKYAMVGVETTSVVEAIMVATSMEELKNG